jgi:REP element-mobilizing transposase RayT
MQEHIHLLKEMPHYQKIYKTLSSAIAEILAPKKD